MTISTPNTPQELFNLNQKTPLEQVGELMTQVNYDDTLKVVTWLVTNLRDFHHQRVQDMMEEGLYDGVPCWVQDETKLNMILNLLDNIS